MFKLSFLCLLLASIYAVLANYFNQQQPMQVVPVKIKKN